MKSVQACLIPRVKRGKTEIVDEEGTMTKNMESQGKCERPGVRDSSESLIETSVGDERESSGVSALAKLYVIKVKLRSSRGGRQAERRNSFDGCATRRYVGRVIHFYIFSRGKSRIGVDRISLLISATMRVTLVVSLHSDSTPVIRPLINRRVDLITIV